MWPQIDLRMRCVSRWKFNYLDLAFEIQRQEVTGMGNTVILPDNGVDLVGSWASIVQIIHSRSQPAKQELTHEDQQNGEDHPNTNANDEHMLSPMHLGLSTMFPDWHIIGNSD